MGLMHELDGWRFNKSILHWSENRPSVLIVTNRVRLKMKKLIAVACVLSAIGLHAQAKHVPAEGNNVHEAPIKETAEQRHLRIDREVKEMNEQVDKDIAPRSVKDYVKEQIDGFGEIDKYYPD